MNPLRAGIAVLESVTNVATNAARLREFFCGFHTARSISKIAKTLEADGHRIVKLANGLYYAASLKELSSTNSTTVEALQDVKELLSPVQKAMQQDILSGAVVTTPDKLRYHLGKSPQDVLVEIRPINHVLAPRNPNLIPVVYQDSGQFYVGWQTKAALYDLLDVSYNDLTSNQPDSPPNTHATSVPAQDSESSKRTMPIPELTARNTIRQAFALYSKNLVFFSLVTACALLPSLTITLLIYPSDGPQIGDMLIFLLIASFFETFVFLALSYAVVGQLRGTPSSTGEIISRGLRSFIPGLLTSIIIALACLVLLAFLAVPGIWASIAWSMAIVIVVTERTYGIEALRRSAQLTKGHRWRIFQILILMYIMMNVFKYIIYLPIFIVIPLEDHTFFIEGPASQVINYLTTVVSVPIMAAAAAYIYTQLYALSDESRSP